MSHPTRRSQLGIIFLTVFLDIVGFAIVLPLLPKMLEYYVTSEGSGSLLQRTLDALVSLSGSNERQNVVALFGAVLMGIYSLLQFVFSPLWGSISDRTGRRPVLLLTIAGIGVSYLLWFFSSSFWILVAARLLGGIMSGNISAASAAVADSTTPEDRPKGMGMVGAAIGLGFTLGPAIGAGFNAIDLTEYFPGLVPLGLNPFSAAALGSLVLAVCNFVWVWTRFEETLSSENRGVAREARRPINPAKLFRPVDIPGVNRANLTYFLYFTAFACLESTLSFLTKDRFGFNERQTGILFFFMGLVLVVVRGGMIRQLAPVYGEKPLTTAGLAILIAGFLVLAWAGKVGAVYLGLGLAAFGSALFTPSLSSLVSLYTPSDRQGSVLGILASLGALARALGPFIAGFLYWRFGSSAPYVCGAVLTGLPLLLTLGLPVPPARVAARVEREDVAES